MLGFEFVTLLHSVVLPIMILWSRGAPACSIALLSPTSVSALSIVASWGFDASRVKTHLVVTGVIRIEFMTEGWASCDFRDDKEEKARTKHHQVSVCDAPVDARDGVCPVCSCHGADHDVVPSQ